MDYPYAREHGWIVLGYIHTIVLGYIHTTEYHTALRMNKQELLGTIRIEFTNTSAEWKNPGTTTLWWHLHNFQKKAQPISVLEISLLVTLGVDTFITKPIMPLIDESILFLSIDWSVERFTGRLKSGRFNSFKQGFIECLYMGGQHCPWW